MSALKYGEKKPPRCWLPAREGRSDRVVEGETELSRLVVEGEGEDRVVTTYFGTFLITFTATMWPAGLFQPDRRLSKHSTTRPNVPSPNRSIILSATIGDGVYRGDG